jgi:hypothetical protein
LKNIPWITNSLNEPAPDESLPNPLIFQRLTRRPGNPIVKVDKKPQKPYILKNEMNTLKNIYNGYVAGTIEYLKKRIFTDGKKVN